MFGYIPTTFSYATLSWCIATSWHVVSNYHQSESIMKKLKYLIGVFLKILTTPQRNLIACKGLVEFLWNPQIPAYSLIQTEHPIYSVI